MSHKTLTLGILLLFICSQLPMVLAEDTTPPITTISFDPPVPDGLNGWYVTQVVITFNATDDDSGVNGTYYRLNNNSWHIYQYAPIQLSDDGCYFIEFYSEDTAGNLEEIQNVSIKKDETSPVVDLYATNHINNIHYTVSVSDETSGINRTEFYDYSVLHSIDYKYPYEHFVEPIPRGYSNYSVKGLILSNKIVNGFSEIFMVFGYVESMGLLSHFCLVYDTAGNSEWDLIEQYYEKHFFFLRELYFSQEYTGFIGRFFIDAEFDTGLV